MSLNRSNPKAGFINTSRLPKGPNGRALCRKCGLEVQKGRRSFCSDECVHQWKLTSQPGYLRDCVKKRDKGVCAACGLDTTRIKRIFRKLYDRFHRPYDRFQGYHNRLNAKIRNGKISKDRLEKFCKAFDWANPNMHIGNIRSLWQADHIVPVCEGGGECSLDNMRTLCVPCHKKETKVLAARRAQKKRKQKQELK